jgi:hypothetical protein
MAVKSFDRSNLKILRDDINEALNVVMKKHGLTHSIGRIGFDDLKFSTKLVVTVGNDVSGDKDVANRAEFERYCRLFDFKKSDFGRSFVSRGETFTICGLSTRAKKYPILAKNSNGDVYKFNENIKSLLQ